MDAALGLQCGRSVKLFGATDQAKTQADGLCHARAYWASEVLFMGTWMPERGPILIDLIGRGVPLTIRGSSWQNAPEWDKLRVAWRGHGALGADYAKAIQCARFLNTQKITSRCTKREKRLCSGATPQNAQSQCFSALGDESRRWRIAAAGHASLIRNGHCNEVVMQRILDESGVETSESDEAPATRMAASAAAA